MEIASDTFEKLQGCSSRKNAPFPSSAEGGAVCFGYTKSAGFFPVLLTPTVYANEAGELCKLITWQRILMALEVHK